MISKPILNVHTFCKLTVFPFTSKAICEIWPQTDQRSDDSNLQHVKGETGRNRYKAVS